MHMLHAAYNALVRIVARAYFEILGDPLTTLFVPLFYSAHAHTYTYVYNMYRRITYTYPEDLRRRTCFSVYLRPEIGRKYTRVYIHKYV